MTKEEILNTFRDLSASQGFYGRLLEYSNEYPEYLDFLESMKFKDKLDLILYLEQ